MSDAGVSCAPDGTAKLRCRAKLNLYLSVGERRDDGYHEIVTLYQTVEHCDVLRLRETGNARSQLYVEGPHASGVPQDESNLLMRAVRLLAAEAGCHLPAFELVLEKNIPAGAGLGGGSSDAGALLRFLRDRYASQLSEEALHRVAGSLGSDVPFLLNGGTAVGTGRGERIEPVASLPPVPVVLAVPDSRLSTPHVYEEWDRQRASRKSLTPPRPLSKIGQILDSITKGSPVPLHNDLAVAAESLAPEIEQVHRELRQHAPLGVAVSGSGSASFALFASTQQAEKTASALEELGIRANATRFSARDQGFL